MTKWLLIGLIGLFQTGERIPTGRGLEQTGGTLEIEKIQTRLTAKPYAAYFDAESTVTLLGLTGDVTMAGLVFSKDRRVTGMRIKGRTASYRHIGDFLLIDMKPSLPKGQRRQLQMSYKGKIFGLSPELAMDFKIRGYTGSLTISPPMSTVEGTIRAEIEVPLKRTNRRLPPLGLQLNDLYQVEAVRWNGQPVPYTHSRGTIRPELKPPLKWGGKGVLEVDYGGKIPSSDLSRVWDNFDNVGAHRNSEGAP